MPSLALHKARIDVRSLIGRIREVSTMRKDGEDLPAMTGPNPLPNRRRSDP
jgi:hypothetical protein